MIHLFEGAGTNQPVAINAARVTKITPDKNDPGLSMIFFASNDYVLVRGALIDVMATLNG